MAKKEHKTYGRILNTPEFRESIRTCMQKYGYTIKQVADYAEISIREMYRVLDGKAKTLRRNVVDKINNMFDGSFEVLISKGQDAQFDIATAKLLKQAELADKFAVHEMLINGKITEKFLKREEFLKKITPDKSKTIIKDMCIYLFQEIFALYQIGSPKMDINNLVTKWSTITDHFKDVTGASMKHHEIADLIKEQMESQRQKSAAEIRELIEMTE